MTPRTFRGLRGRLDLLWQEDGLSLRDLGARAHDRRAVRLWLTDSGRGLREQVRTEVQRQDQALEDVLLKYMSRGDLKVLHRGLQVLAEQLPEGEDLLAAVMVEWRRRMERLRTLAEDDHNGGGGGQG